MPPTDSVSSNLTAQPIDAGPWLRVGAKLIDHGLWVVAETLLVALGALLNAFGLPPLTIALGFVASGILWYVYVYRLTALRGQTIGKMAAHIRVVGADGQIPPESVVLRRVLVEAAFDMAGVVFMAAGWLFASISGADKIACALSGAGLGSIIGLVDPFYIFITRRRQAIHDLAAGTFVVRQEPVPVRSLPRLAAGATILWLAVPFIIVRPFLVEAYVVPSGSMEPTIQVGDRILANKLVLRLRAPRHGEIVMFRAPNWVDEEGKIFVKRVVGVPGDRLEVRDGKLLRNDQPVDEPYISEPPAYEWPEPGEQVEVPKGQVVVLGDNRNDSFDAHLWRRITADGRDVEDMPFLPMSALRGRLVYRYWPPDRMGTVAQEEYAR